MLPISNVHHFAVNLYAHSRLGIPASERTPPTAWPLSAFFRARWTIFAMAKTFSSSNFLATT